MYAVYVLYSLKDNKLYKGSTSNVQKRFLRHNSGGNKSTAHRKPFVLIHIEQFEDKSSALRRESYLVPARKPPFFYMMVNHMCDMWL